MTIEPVGTYVAKWGEGAMWWEGKLLYVDIEGHRVIRFDPISGVEEIWEVGERVGTVVPRKQGGFVIAGDRGFSFLGEDGKLEWLGDPEAELADNRFNDGKCSPDGRFFAGTISLTKKTGSAALYRLDPDGTIEQAYGPVTNSNGIVWSAEGDRVYYIDTPKKEIVCFRYEGGRLLEPRVVVAMPEREASPDGMTLDADGNLWVAFCHGACVVCYDPSSGEELRQVDLPCLETTSCAFGGEDLGDLYVTTGVHRSVEEKDAGRLWVIRGLGVKGLPGYGFGG